MGGQHHMAMEPVSARVAPIEDGYDVLDTTIWPAESQSVVAQVLNVDASRSVWGGNEVFIHL